MTEFFIVKKHNFGHFTFNFKEGPFQMVAVTSVVAENELKSWNLCCAICIFHNNRKKHFFVPTCLDDAVGLSSNSFIGNALFRELQF